MRCRGTSLLLLCSFVALPGCPSKDDDSDDNDNNPPPTSWLVGDEGEMLRLTADDDVSSYPLQLSDDLNAIACLGEASAWVAGDAGTVLLTRDAGESWDFLDLGLHADLRSIAVSEGQPEGRETVWIAGYGGELHRSVDGGVHFSAVESPELDWTSATTDPTGRYALVASLDGSLWRSDDGASLELAHASDGGALHAVRIDHHGEAVVAVGEDGRVLRADGITEAFSAVDVPTRDDLYAVHVTAHAETIIAIGDGGTAVVIDDSGTRTETWGPQKTLYGLHLRADGHGQAVGEGGTVLLTEDGGAHWRHVPTGNDRDLRGVDDFHSAPHL